MSRIALVCVLGGLVLAGAAFAATETSAVRKHSGVIVAVAPNAGTITVDEMGPWAGPNSTPVRETVAITSSTTIQLDSRSAGTGGPGGWPGGFQASPLRASELRPGDFATVTIEQSRGGPVAASIAVVRPSTVTAAK
jgi:hypothetical protein